MLYTKPKKEALTIHERAISKYNLAFQKMERLGGCLYEKRCDCVTLLREIEFLVTTIANRPKEFDKKISKIQAERESFRETESYAAEAINAAIKSGISAAAGTAGGVATAKWVATIFGTESTGAALSALSGTAATNAAVHLGGKALADGIARSTGAALSTVSGTAATNAAVHLGGKAIADGIVLSTGAALSTVSGAAATNAAVHLGGGALAAGGAGVTGSQALLALAGPIGWGITGVTTAASVFALGHKNKKIADEAIAAAKKSTIAGAEVDETSAQIQHLTDETVMLMDSLRDTVQVNWTLKGKNYLELSEDEQYRLGTMVNNTLALAEMLNKTI